MDVVVVVDTSTEDTCRRKAWSHQKFSSDTAAWRKWKAEILRFLDTDNPGMQMFMIELEKNRKM